MQIIFSLLAAAAVADRLEHTYLPPFTAQSAGGSGSFLSTPFHSGVSSFSRGSSFGASGFGGSSAYPHANVGQYYAPVQSYHSAHVPILRYNNQNNGDGSYQFE